MTFRAQIRNPYWPPSFDSIIIIFVFFICFVWCFCFVYFRLKFSDLEKTLSGGSRGQTFRGEREQNWPTINFPNFTCCFWSATRSVSVQSSFSFLLTFCPLYSPFPRFYFLQTMPSASCQFQDCINPQTYHYGLPDWCTTWNLLK